MFYLQFGNFVFTIKDILQSLLLVIVQLISIVIFVPRIPSFFKNFSLPSAKRFRSIFHRHTYLIFGLVVAWKLNLTILKSEISQCSQSLPQVLPRILYQVCFKNDPSYALSFYRSQNVLCWSKFFEPAQIFFYILCQSQTFCARLKDDKHSVKLVFVPAQKF